MSRDATFCVLTYGDHVDLCRRAIESIRKHCPRRRYSLVVGANAISHRMSKYLEGLKEAKELDHLVVSETNLNKGRMMPRMLRWVETELVWWMDDDSYVRSSRTFAYYLERVRSSPPSIVQWGQMAWCDHPRGFTRVADIVAWVRQARWFRGLPPPSWEPGGKGEFDFEGRGTGDGRWVFILGGCWVARMAALRELKWPDPRLIRYGEDVLLGEAIRQQGWSLMNTGGWGLAIDAAPRRGLKARARTKEAPH